MWRPDQRHYAFADRLCQKVRRKRTHRGPELRDRFSNPFLRILGYLRDSCVFDFSYLWVTQEKLPLIHAMYHEFTPPRYVQSPAL